MAGRYIVPQFIDEEAKILGKITVRQFVILILAFIIEFIIFRYGSIGLFLVSLLFVAAPAALFSFAKINGQKFHIFLLHFIFTNKRPKLRVWNKNISNEDARFSLSKFENRERKESKKIIQKKRLSSSRLAELSLVVDTGGVYRGQKQIDYEQTKTNNSAEN
jgi:hypothetical protein